MGDILKVYDNGIDSKSIEKIVRCLEEGGIVIFPTDSLYAIGCAFNRPKSIAEIKSLKGKKDRNLSLIVSDIKMASEYVQIDDSVFRLLKENTPAPFTFVLRASSRIPNSFFDRKRNLGIRIPNNEVLVAVIRALGVPIVSTSIPLLSVDEQDCGEPSLIWEEYADKVDMMIDAGRCNEPPTTVVDLSSGEIELLREGKLALKE